MIDDLRHLPDDSFQIITEESAGWLILVAVAAMFVIDWVIR